MDLIAFLTLLSRTGRLSTMDDPVNSSTHRNFAGRKPAGTEHPVVLSKNGVRHVSDNDVVLGRRLGRLVSSDSHCSILQVMRYPNGDVRELYSVGLACSECFSGETLHNLLKPGFEYEMKTMQALMNNDPAEPLSIHTSAGVSESLGDFLTAIEPHLPWKEPADWCVSLQLEGASAVWAAIDMCLQVLILETGNMERKKVAVGGTSYHGPPSTSFGAKSPMWHKHYQLIYPTPQAGVACSEEDMLRQFREFLDLHGDEIGVLLIEPQWGSSQAGFPWPKSLLKQYVEITKSYGIKVVCDEIMCGLGRHGHGTLFVAEAWDLDPDCVTFGKSIGGGVYNISGAILKYGRELLAASKLSVMQSHTYAGSNTRALMTATEVLKEFPNWKTSVTKLGEEMGHIFRYVTKLSDGMVICHGQGLMWGGLFTTSGQNSDEDFRNKVIETFKAACDEAGILPYHVPVGGFMVSPVIDIDVGTVYEIGERFEKAIKKTMEVVGWVKIEGVTPSMEPVDLAKLAEVLPGIEKCNPVLHRTRSCTSCSSFVSEKVRTHFLNV